MALSLRRNIAWMTSGRIVYAACQWAIVVVLARLGGPAMVGEFAFALALTAPIVIFSQLQMRQVLITDVKSNYRFSDYFAVRLTTTALALASIAAFLPLGGYAAASAFLILIVGLAKAFESLSDLFYALEQRHERVDLVGLSLIMRSLSGLAVVATTVYFTGNLVLAAAAMAACWAAVWFWFDRRVTRPWRQEVAVSDSRRSAFWARVRLAQIGLPLGCSLMLGSLNTNTPRYFLEAEFGMEAVGRFAAVVHFYAAGILVVTAIGQVLTVRLANYFAAGKFVAFQRLQRKMLIFATLVGVIGVIVAFFLGRQILSAVYGTGFGQDAEVFFWVMITGMISYWSSCLGFGLTAMRVFNVQPVFLGVTVAVTVLGCYMLVPTYGVLGAVWAWAGSLVCQCAMFWIAGLRRMKASGAGMPPQQADQTGSA